MWKSLRTYWVREQWSMMSLQNEHLCQISKCCRNLTANPRTLKIPVKVNDFIIPMPSYDIFLEKGGSPVVHKVKKFASMTRCCHLQLPQLCTTAKLRRQRTREVIESKATTMSRSLSRNCKLYCYIIVWKKAILDACMYFCNKCKEWSMNDRKYTS